MNDLAAPKIELVVAHYDENLNWLRNVPPVVRKTVYDKNPASAYPGAVALPNAGREAHTYLHHIVQHYQRLLPLTVFCQGKPFDHASDFHQTLRRLAADVSSLKGREGFEWLGHLIDTDDARGELLFATWSKNEDARRLDMEGFYGALFGESAPEYSTFRGGAQFAVTRECILRREPEFYRRALEVSLTFPDAAHCFERSWPHVFGVENPDEEWLQNRRTVYLKPVRRLQK